MKLAGQLYSMRKIENLLNLKANGWHTVHRELQNAEHSSHTVLNMA
jgi:hypothetical protein